MNYNTHGFVQFDIAILSSLSANKRKVCLCYRSTWLSQQQAESVASIFQQAMESIRHNSIKNISQISLFSPRCQQLLQSWDRPPVPRVDRCVHQIVEEQSRLRPNEKAIHAWDGDLSYSELEGYSNKLACHLLDLGVCSGENVALLMDKSRWAVVGMISTLKAGAVCVPLDRGYPAARIETILESVTADVVLTDEANSPRLNGEGKNHLGHFYPVPRSVDSSTASSSIYRSCQCNCNNTSDVWDNGNPQRRCLEACCALYCCCWSLSRLRT